MATAPTADLLEQHLREATLADGLGYHTSFVIEHHSSYIRITSPSAYLAAVPQRTRQLRLGAMLHVLPFHTPSRLAQQVALFDQLSRGRVEFGTGICVHEHEVIRWTLPFYERQAMASEALEIILKAWAEERVTYEGEYRRFDEAIPIPRPYQPPYPPVWVGAHSPASFEYAARPNFHVAQNLDMACVVAEKCEIYRQAWRQHSHPSPMPRMFLTRYVHLAATGRTRPVWVSKGCRIPPPLGSYSPSSRACAIPYEFWIDNGLALVGSPETVVKRIQEQQARVGNDLLCTNHRFGGMSAELVVNSMTLSGP